MPKNSLKVKVFHIIHWYIKKKDCLSPDEMIYEYQIFISLQSLLMIKPRLIEDYDLVLLYVKQ